MNRNNQRRRFSILILIVLFVAARGTPLAAQNVRIGNDDKGAAYTATTADSGKSMTFTRSEATVTVTASQEWNGVITFKEDGIIQVNNPSQGGGATVFTVKGGMTGAGAFTKTGSGTILLDSVSTMTGPTYINGGTLKVSANGVLSPTSGIDMTDGTTLDLSEAKDQEIGSLSGNGDVVFKAGSTLSSGENGYDTTFAGTFSGGAGKFEKVGTGTMFINSDVSTFAGTIQVADGTLGGNGTLGTVVVDRGAVLAPGSGSGSVGTMTIDNLKLESGSTLKMRVDDSGGHDQAIIGSGATTTGANLVFDAIAGSYANTPLVYKNFLEDSSGSGITTNFAQATLNQAFLESNWANDVLTITGRTPNYFYDEAVTPNQQQVARALDNATSTGPWNAMTQISQWIKGGNDQAAVQAAYNDLAGDLKANSMMIGQWQTSRYGLNHLDLTECGLSQGNGVWLEFIHQSTDFSGDANSGDYGISRTGFLVGSEERRVDVTYGFFVGYAYPYLYDHGDKVEVNDLQFGFYGGSKVREFLETKLFIGYGHQGYKSKRYLTSEPLAGLSDDNRIDGKYSGDSMSMALEFAVPLSAGMVSLRPLFAIDSDLTWQYAFTETGDTGVELWYDRGFLNRTYLRTGVTTQLGSVSQCDTLALMGRFYYGHQVFGDSRPETRCKFATETTADRMTIYGVDPGKDYIDLGLGFRWNIDSCRSFYGDYDFNAFSDSTAHWGSLGYMQKW